MSRRPLLQPLVPLYAAGLALKRRVVEERPGYARWLREPVVSVGSLSAGGAGKTPVVEALARLLVGAGYGVDVLSRGYGRAGAGVERVKVEGTAERFGDEPLLLARGLVGLGVGVYVGGDRVAAGLMAELSNTTGKTKDKVPGSFAPLRMTEGVGLDEEWQHGPDGAGQGVHLLDDGMQHRRLGRALDVVLLTAEDVEDRLLPVGNLREPLGELRRAGAVVVRVEEEARVWRAVERYGRAGVPVWRIVRRLLVEDLGGRRVVAFCGIARPKGFFAMLREAGVEIIEGITFRDHHRYTARDVKELMQVAQRVGAEGFVTTGKDAVKLEGALRGRLEDVGPVLIGGLEVEFQDAGLVLAGVEEALAARLA